MTNTLARILWRQAHAHCMQPFYNHELIKLRRGLLRPCANDRITHKPHYLNLRQQKKHCFCDVLVRMGGVCLLTRPHVYSLQKHAVQQGTTIKHSVKLSSYGPLFTQLKQIWLGHDLVYRQRGVAAVAWPDRHAS